MKSNYYKIRYANNKDKIKSQRKINYNKNRDKILARRKVIYANRKINKTTYYSKNKDKVRNYYLNRQYKISREVYNQMFMKQLGLCAACHEPFGKETPAVDHCHKTNKVRGLLHRKCNTALGFIEDAKFKLWLEYIEASKV